MYFDIDSMKFERAIRRGDAEGRPVKVLYHSHLDVGAYFSATDAEVAKMGQGEPPWDLAYLVTSVRAARSTIGSSSSGMPRDATFVESAPRGRRGRLTMRSLADGGGGRRADRPRARVALGAPRAGAQLRASVERLAEAWRGVGASVVVDRPRFLNDDDDDPVVIVLPDLPEGECTTVVLLGARGLGFHARPSADGRRPTSPTPRIPSEAGAPSRSSAAARRRRSGCSSTSDSGRGALETVVARSAKPLRSLRSVLPERTGAAVLLRRPSRALLPPLPLPEKRADVAEARARRDGASVSSRETWRRAPTAAGRPSATLDAGLPRAAALRGRPARRDRPVARGKLDLDAEMRDASGDRMLARDRTDAPDAQPRRLRRRGDQGRRRSSRAPRRGAPVLVAHCAWPLPEHLPALWGSEARGAHGARAARAARHVAARRAGAARAGRVGGDAGARSPSSPAPATSPSCPSCKARPGRSGCASTSARRDAFDDRGIDEDGAVGRLLRGRSRTYALADVEARGTPLLGWGLALYRVQAPSGRSAP